MGCSGRWCCGRSFFLGRPLRWVGSSLPGAGRGSSVDLGLAAQQLVECSAGDRLQGWVAELLEDVEAALEQLASQGETRAVTADPLRGLHVIRAVGAGRKPGALRGFIQIPPQCRPALAGEVPRSAVL